MNSCSFLAVWTLVALTCSPAIVQSASFGGANSFYLHSYRTNDQITVLDAMQRAGLKTLRIFISAVGSNAKGSNNYEAKDAETSVGTYDDSSLVMVDSLMLRAYQRGIKLIITLHDRYSLGCWGYDAYVSKYKVPTTNDCGSSAITNNDLTSFYRSSAASADMDRRFAHIVAHKNPNFGNRSWSSIPEAVFGFDIENEAQAHQLNGAIPNPNWICDRARNLKPRLASGILVLTGGGAAVWDSVIPQHFSCPSIDVVAIHSYGDDWSSALPPLINTAKAAGKRILVEEFGATGSSKASRLQSQIAVFQNLGVPWMVWEVNKPNNLNDYEVFTDDTASWSVLSSAALAAQKLTGAFQWPEIFPSISSPPPRQQSSSPPPPPKPSSPPPPPHPSVGKCDKCNIPVCHGGCKCDAACNCQPNLGGGVCDKCNLVQAQGGCKCDSSCGCLPGSCWF